jgi:hypothetical protein
MNRVVTLYPAAGFRYQTSGAFSVVGSTGYAWSSAITGASAYFLSFPTTLVYPTTSHARAYGWSVRCVQNLLLSL